MKPNALTKVWNNAPPLVKVGVYGVAGFFIYKKIKKLITTPPPVTLPEGGQGLPVVGHTATGSPIFWNPAPLSKDLHNVMKGLFTLSGSKDEVFTKLGTLPSGDMVTAVYNYFNENYGAGDSLTQWIKDEWWTDWTGAGKDLALNRLNSLGLA